MIKLTSGSYGLQIPNGRVSFTGRIDQADRAIIFLIEHGNRKFQVKISLDYISRRRLSDLVLREIIFDIARAFATQDECPCKIESGWLDLDSTETSRPWPVREKKSWIEYL